MTMTIIPEFYNKDNRFEYLVFLLIGLILGIFLMYLLWTYPFASNSRMSLFELGFIILTFQFLHSARFALLNDRVERLESMVKS